MLTKSQFPFPSAYSVSGAGKHKGPTALALKRAMKRGGYGFKGTAFDDLTTEFNNKLEIALDKWDMGNNDGYGEGRWNRIRRLHLKDGSYALDSVAQKLVQAEANALLPHVPALGPIFNGGLSILQHDLTHATDNIPLYPAFDDAFSEGTRITAPEVVTVTKQSSSNPGDAFYATGQSGIRYWFGHLVSAPATGTRFIKGGVVGVVGPNHVGGGPHCHVGINVEGIWGPGAQLAHHTDYSHGAPLVGAQLKMHQSL